MPRKETVEKARKARREGKSASTQAGEFIKETIDEIRQGKIGARSTTQALAIGLSKARRAGVDLPPPPKGRVSETTRKSATRAYQIGQSDPKRRVSRKRSQATTRALRREGQMAASHESLSRQAKRQANRRTKAQRSAIGRKAAETRLAHQTAAERKAIARKAARTRRAHAKSKT
ncbi:MAG: hypothetical protein ACT4QC_18420 [Planctomycetaceae bacterium]